jgi:hypothetical protein
MNFSDAGLCFLRAVNAPNAKTTSPIDAAQRKMRTLFGDKRASLSIKVIFLLLAKEANFPVSCSEALH